MVDSDDIDLLCLSILEAVSKRENLVKEKSHAVASGHAIGDALINLLCCAVLECLSYYGEPPPHSFQILIKYKLQMFENSIKQQRVLRDRKVFVALFVAENPAFGVREIARGTGLNASTISRWLADEYFLSYVKMFRAKPLGDRRIANSAVSAECDSEALQRNSFGAPYGFVNDG
jgi:hypothetical protein